MDWRTSLLLGCCLGFGVSQMLVLLSSPSSSSDAATATTTTYSTLDHRILSSIDHPEGEEGGKEKDESMLLDTTISVIVIILIAVTILFEHVKESLEETVDRTMKPMMEGLFGELTVLGFLSIITFLVTKLGWFTTLSEMLFGHEHEEENELLETFEFVHYMLFFIMVCFVFNVLVLVHGGKAMDDQWWVMNAACQDPQCCTKLDTNAETSKTTWLQFFCQSLFPFGTNAKQQTRRKLQLFRGLRHEFILERSMDPPFAPHATNCVTDDFDFGQYLCICMGHELAHMVHLKIATWVFLALVTVCFYLIIVAIENDTETFAWIWAGSGWLCFLVGNYFDFHMLHLLECMRAAQFYDNQDANANTSVDESDPLLAQSSPSSTPQPDSLPLWTRIDLDEYLLKRRPFLARLCLPAELKLTRQDSLYWMERKGPKLYLVLFQIQLVFTAAYVSLLVLSFYPYMLRKSTHTTMLERCGYLIVSVLPVFLLLSKYRVAAANLTMATSVGVHRRPQAVSQVIREAKTARIIRALVTMQRLQQQASEGGFINVSEPSPSNANGNSSPDTKMASLQLEEAKKTFDAFDKSGDGTIDCSELKEVLSVLGAPPTEHCLGALLQQLDRNGDGIVSKDEFLHFYKTHVLSARAMNSRDIHHMAKTLFQQIDRDGSGEITLSEFSHVLETFNVGFTMNEIGDIVNELDEQDNGTIGEHEFAHMLKKHRHVFDPIPLPEFD